MRARERQIEEKSPFHSPFFLMMMISYRLIRCLLRSTAATLRRRHGETGGPAGEHATWKEDAMSF